MTRPRIRHGDTVVDKRTNRLSLVVSVGDVGGVTVYLVRPAQGALLVAALDDDLETKGDDGTK